MSNYKVKIGDWKTRESHSESLGHSVQSAVALLWACANTSVPEYAEANIGDHKTPVDNARMRGTEAPSLAAEDKRDDLNRIDIESLVQEALNGIYDELAKRGDVPGFVEIVTDAAREWAEECYQ